MRWAEHAACRGMPTEWFYSWGTGRRNHAAKVRPRPVRQEVVDACNRCPVREACLTHAIAHWEDGYWGGTSTDQRTQMRAAGARRRRLEADMARFDWPPNAAAARKQRQRAQRRREETE